MVRRVAGAWLRQQPLRQSVVSVVLCACPKLKLRFLSYPILQLLHPPPVPACSRAADVERVQVCTAQGAQGQMLTPEVLE